MGHPIGGKRRRKGKGFCVDDESLKPAHRYIIFNANNEQVEKFIEEHKSLINQNRGSRWVKERSHSLQFISWFQDKVKNEVIDDHIFWLANGPYPKARRYRGYFVNGYRFCTKERDSRLKTQNSGVTLSALTPSFASSKDKNHVLGDVTYYGAIQEIFELDFWSNFYVTLFRCDWFCADIYNYGLTRVSFRKLCYKDDPFVLASQVHQVFYVQDMTFTIS